MILGEINMLTYFNVHLGKLHRRKHFVHQELLHVLKQSALGERGALHRVSIFSSGYLCGKSSLILMKKLGTLSR